MQDDAAQPQTPGDEGQRPSRLEQRIGGRPLMVYLVLLAGAGTLILLLVIVWISATGGGNESTPICLDITRDNALNEIAAGNVKKVNILVDTEQPETGPSAIQLDMVDNTCRKLPQGADNRMTLLEVLGAVEYYNSTGDQRIRTNYMRENLPAELLVTSTPTAAPTTPPTAAPTTPPTEPATEPATVPVVETATAEAASPTAPPAIETPTAVETIVEVIATPPTETPTPSAETPTPTPTP